MWLSQILVAGERTQLLGSKEPPRSALAGRSLKRSLLPTLPYPPAMAPAGEDPGPCEGICVAPAMMAQPLWVPLYLTVTECLFLQSLGTCSVG